MKILHFVHGFLPHHTGGTEQYVLGVLRELKQRGHTVAVVSGSEEARDEATIERDGRGEFPVFRLHRAGLYLESWYQGSNPEVEVLIRELLEDLRPDVIHIHHWRRLTTRLVDVAVKMGIPTVLTIHDAATTCAKTFRVRNESLCLRDPIAENCRNCVQRFWFQTDNEIDRRVENYRREMARELDLATAVVAPSHAAADLVEQYQPTISDKIEVLPHPRLYPPCPPEPRTSQHGGALRLVYWGAIQPMKGVHLLLESLRRTNDPSKFSLDIWGGLDQAPEGYADRLYELAKDLDVQFKGRFDPRDVPDDYDLAVFPSIATETYSFTVDEAFERKIPVIVPDRGAPVERWSHADCVFNSEDASALAERLNTLEQNRVRIDELRTLIPSLISMAEHGDELEDLYSWCLSEFERPATKRFGSGLERATLIQEVLRSRDERLYELRGRADGDSEQAKSLKVEIAERERVIAKKDEVLDDFNVNLGALTKALKERDRELEKARNQIVEKEAFLSYRIEENDEIVATQKNELRLYAQSVEDLEREKSRLENELAQAHQQLTTLNESVKEAHDGLASGANERSSLQQSITDYEARVRELSQEVESIRVSLSDHEARKTQAETAQSELQTKLETEQKDRARLESELRAVRRQLAEKDEEAAVLRDEVASLKHNFASQEREAMRQLEHLRDQTEQVSSEKVLLEAAKIEAESERDRIESEMEDLSALVDRLKSLRDSLMSEVEAQSSRGDATKEALEAALHEIRRLDARVGDMSQGIVERLRPIAAEVAPHDLSDTSVDELIGLVISNHTRLHTLISERDHVLNDLVLRIDEYESRQALGQGGANGALGEARTDVARKFKSRIRGLTKKLKPRSQRGKKRILFVVHDFLPKHNAGTEIYTFNLATGLQSEYDVHLLFCEARHELPRYQVRKGTYKTLPFTEVVHNYQWENFEETYHDPRMEAIFEDVLDEFDPDLVHIQHLHYFSFNFIPIAKGRGIPVVYTLHEFMLMCARGGQLLREDMGICEFPVPEKCADCISGHRLAGDYGQQSEKRARDRVADLLPENLRQAFEGYAGPRIPSALDESGRQLYAAAAQRRLDFIQERIAQVDLFISPSGFLRQKFIDAGMIRPDQIVHSDNGFDVSPFQGFQHVPSSTLRFGFVGTIAEYKGVHIIIEAMNEIRADDVELKIYGDLETFVEYKAKLLPLVKNKATKLMGRFDNTRIAEVLSEIDVLIVPSLWFENSPLTIHEAWLANVPLLVSNRGGMAELVKDGVNGFHFKLGDAEDLRQKMMRFVQDRSLVRKMGDQPGVVKTIADNVVEMKGRYQALLEGARR